MQKIHQIVLLCAALGLLGCARPSQPRPYGYFRIDVPEYSYQTTDLQGYPYRFEIAGIARIDMKDSRALLYRAGTGGICNVVDLPDGNAVRKLSVLFRAVGAGSSSRA